jgi:cell division septation protein DedD
MLSRRGGDPVRRLVTLKFENDLLVMTDGVGDSTGGDIKALAGTQAAVAGIDDVETAKATQLQTDDGVIDWTIQLGAFNTREEAVKFADEVRSKGYEARLMEQVVPGLGTRHQVRSGLYDTYNEAFTALRAMERDLNVVGITVPVDVPKDE